MGHSNDNLAALIGSRICHDLISPIGAITNGLELLEMTGSTDGPEIELISDSVGNAGARIRFFRIAYGAAGDQMLGRAEIDAVLRDLNRSGRLQVDWAAGDDQPRAHVRLAFLALQCCETAMPYGGEVRVNENGGRWQVRGTADKINADPELWGDLAHGTQKAEITPALVQFALLPALAADAKRQVEVEIASEAVTLTF